MIQKVTSLMAAGAASVAFGAAYLDNVSIPPTGSLAVRVTSGEATLSGDRITVGENVLVKGGEGTLAIRNANIDQATPLRVNVTEGSVRLDTSVGDRPAAATLSAAIQAKMIWWGAIDDEAHLLDDNGAVVSHLTDGAKVNVWYDKRETDVANPTYCRMAVFNTAKGYPVFRAASYGSDSWRGLYFGGWQSGIGMQLLNADGSQYLTINAHQIFAIHGQTADNLGPLAGSSSDNLSIFVPYIDGWYANRYLAPTDWIGNSARCWLDGRVIAGADTAVRKGLHAITYASPAAANESTLTSWAGSFCNWCNNCPAIFVNTGSSWDSYGGGDDVVEYIIFNQTLSERERLEVENYLMRRWNFKTANPEKRLALAAGTTATVDVAAGETVGDAELAAVGNGRLVKTGAGTYANDLSVVDGDAGANPSAIDLQGGTVLMRRLANPIVAGAGQTISATDDTTLQANRIEIGDAAAGELVKTGSERVRVTGLGSDVRVIDVQAGTLLIGGESDAAEPRSDVWTDEIAIPNAGFETWDRGSAGYLSLGSEDQNGWMKTSGDGALFADYTYYSTYRDDFGLGNIRAPEGTSLMFLRMQRTGRSTVRTSSTLHFEKPGDYEFSCSLFGRMQDWGNEAWGYFAFMVPVRVRLLKSDGATVAADFGMIRLTSASGFQPKALRVNVEEAGEYYLQLEAFYNCWREVSSWIDYCILLDDLHIRRLGPVDGKTWRLPNGDFETAEVLLPKYNGSHTTEWRTYFADNNHCTGWAFNDPSGWTDSKPAVGLVNPFMTVMAGRGFGDCFHGREQLAYNGALELLFRGTGANVVTEFTPPKGTWRLSAMLANKYVVGWSGTLNATMTIGGESVSLGDLSVNHQQLRRETWPTAITVDGETAVTLTLTYASGPENGNCGIVADDFILTRRFYPDSEELLPQGTLTSGFPGWTPISGTYLGSGYCPYVALRAWGETPEAFGDGYFGGGDGAAEIWGDSGMSTTVTLPCAGRYRLTYLTRRRIAWGDSQDVVFSLTNPGGTATNVIDFSEMACTAGAMERRDAYFTVSEGGTYTLTVRGTVQTGSTTYFQNISDISIRPAFDEPETLPIVSEPVVKVASGAKLHLDFNGTAKVARAVIGGKRAKGIVSRETHPDYIFGDGKLEVRNEGFMLIVK